MEVVAIYVSVGSYGFLGFFWTFSLVLNLWLLYGDIATLWLGTAGLRSAGCKTELFRFWFLRIGSNLLDGLVVGLPFEGEFVA